MYQDLEKIEKYKKKKDLTQKTQSIITQNNKRMTHRILSFFFSFNNFN
jgi:hypothetical protein